jgi:hypothetical protein
MCPNISPKIRAESPSKGMVCHRNKPLAAYLDRYKDRDNVWHRAYQVLVL